MHNDFFIRCDNKYIRISPQDIRYIECVENWARIVTPANTYLALISLRQLEAELPAPLFCRVHRAYIVGLTHISSFDHESVYMGKDIIPISPVYKNALPGKVKLLINDRRVRTGTEGGGQVR